MARKPIHLEAAGKQGPRERMWAAIRFMRVFTRDQLCRLAKVEERTADSYLECLAAGGFISKGTGDTQLFRLDRDIGIEAPRLTRDGQPVKQGGVTRALWLVMHIHKGDFDYRELTAEVRSAEVPITTATVRTYCGFLIKAGYLSITRSSKPGTPARFRLVKYTGPKAPMIQRVKHVYDPNLGEVVWHPEANS